MSIEIVGIIKCNTFKTFDMKKKTLYALCINQAWFATKLGGLFAES